MSVQEEREARANAINSYYNAYSDYLKFIEADGGDTIVTGDELQPKFNAFNDLIALFSNTLKSINGYAFDSSCMLSSSKATIPSGEWWSNADVTNQRSSLFYQDVPVTMSNGSEYILNMKNDPYKRHPFLYWNQYSSVLGSIDKRGWKNTESKSDYNSAQNPYATGDNYRLAEPLECHGDSNNTVWGKAVHNGEFHYRRDYNKQSYEGVSDSGFLNFFSNGKPIEVLSNPFTVSNIWPSPFEIMRHVYWGSGSDSTEGTSNITSPTATMFQSDTGYSVNTWYLIYRVGASYLIKVTDSLLVPPDPESGGQPYYQITYTGSTVTAGIYSKISNPRIPAANKTATQSNAKDSLWTNHYNTYYSKFKDRVDGISSSVTTIINNLTSVINFDYSVVNQVAGSDLGKTEATNLRTQLTTWLTQWKSLVGDVGSGATFAVRDSKWSDASLDSIANKLKELINFTTNYSGAQSGILASGKTTIYNVLGVYNKGPNEVWFPTNLTASNNNTGSFTNSLYYFRHDIAKSRLDKEKGTLVGALNSYKTYTSKLTEINALNTKLSAFTTDYDVTPVGVNVTVDEEDKITISWEAVTGASSYDIEYKEGLDGPWTSLVSGLGYVAPGNPPDFTKKPPTEYKVQAFTKGYQSIILNTSDPDSLTNLADNFTLYTLELSLDGNAPVVIKLKGMDCKTYSALITTLTNYFKEKEIKASVKMVNNTICVYSETLGAASRVVIAGNLISSLGATIGSSINGDSFLEDGKVYYFRIRVNNGYGINWGGTLEKDWNSKSDWHCSLLKNDAKVNGSAGIVIWDEVENLRASGVEDNDLEKSDNHITIAWNPAENASSYKVYRATSNNGGYAYIGNTTNTYYNDDTAIAGVTYWYKVKPIANSNHQLYKADGTFSGPLEGAINTAGARGKKLWQTVSLTATTTDKEKMTLNWNALSGANGYLVYVSNMENGRYSYLTNDDATEMIITDNYYVHATSAFQYFEKQFTDPTESIVCEPNKRYYFIVIASDRNGIPSVKQYYVSSSTGNWTAQQLVDAIQAAISEGLNNIKCELLAMNNLAPTTIYKIKFSTVDAGENTSISIIDGTFGDSLIPIIGKLENAQPGGGSFPGLKMFYRVEAVEVIDGVIVRRSELSNIVMGTRPIL